MIIKYADTLKTYAFHQREQNAYLLSDCKTHRKIVDTTTLSYQALIVEHN
jgi:hypothetical protein